MRSFEPDAIAKMPRKDFRAKILHKVAQMDEFGHLESTGARSLSQDEKASLVQAFTAVGIIPPQDDEGLDALADAIITRSVTLK
ncbi:hypothetical protein IJJ18_02770 [Candidatus Saccharibacteria bacterium]|nr:hypothetical protein [Candidatus Saccharibacteria bacterium]